MSIIEAIDGTLFLSEDENEVLGSKMQWSNKMTKLLIQSFKDMEDVFHDDKTRKKVCWDNVAKLMLCHGYRVSGEKCDSKWRALKRQYSVERNKMKETGNTPTDWVFYDDMHDILKRKPEYAPVAIASNLKGVQIFKGEAKGNNKNENSSDKYIAESLHERTSTKNGNKRSSCVEEKSDAPEQCKKNCRQIQEERYATSVQDRQKKRRNRQHNQQTQILEELRSERKEQFERTFAQREQYLNLLKQLVPKKKD